MKDKMIKYLTKKEVFIVELNKAIEKLGKLEIQILVLQRTDPKKVIGTAPAVTDNQGRVAAQKGVEAQDLLKTNLEEKEGLEKRITIIEHLIKEA